MWQVGTVGASPASVTSAGLVSAELLGGGGEIYGLD